MPSAYQQLRKALHDEVTAPGPVTKDEVKALLRRFPEDHPDDKPQPPSDGLLRLG